MVPEPRGSKIRLVWLRFASLVSTVALVATGCAPQTHVTTEAITPTTTLEVEAMVADLDFIAATLRDVHPALQEPTPRVALERLAASLVAQVTHPMPVYEHFARAARLTASLRDAHTRLVSADRYLPLELTWLSDGLAVAAAAQTTGARVGDEVVSIGGRSPLALLTRLRPLAPAENDQWLRFIASEYLTRETPLRALGVVEDDASVGVELRGADGTEREVRLSFLDERPLFGGERPYFGWELRGGHGWFWLDACRDTSEYRRAVAEFFAAVSEAGLQTVVIDLRRNGGGQSSVDEAILTYLPAREVAAYRYVARPSRQALGRFGPVAELTQWLRGLFWDGRRAVPAPADPTHVFGGELIVAIGPGTFSAASDLATLLHDNGLALLVGEATGGAPSSYGDILRFQVPSGSLTFSVSFKSFTRPDPARDPAHELTPDVPLPATIEDLRSGQDPVARWLETRPWPTVPRAPGQRALPVGEGAGS